MKAYLDNRIGRKSPSKGGWYVLPIQNGASKAPADYQPDGECKGSQCTQAHRDGNLAGERHDGRKRRGSHTTMIDTTSKHYSSTDSDESRDHGSDIERHKRGVLNIKEAYGWAAANDGPGGALGFVLKKLAHALESGRRESLRCLLDTISVNGEFTDHDGNTTTAGHNISGALARIIAYVRPDLVTAIELRPSPLLDSIDISEVLSGRELRIFE